MSVMTGPMQRLYGTTPLVSADESKGRINPALEDDEELPIVETQSKRLMKQCSISNPFRPEIEAKAGVADRRASQATQGSTAF